MEDGDQVDAHLEQVCCPLLCMRVLTPLIMCSLVVMHTRVCDRLSSGLGVHHILRVFLYLPGLSPVVYQVRNADQAFACCAPFGSARRMPKTLCLLW